MQRRKFVKQGTALAAGGVLWSCGASTESKTNASNQMDVTSEAKRGLGDFGIQLYSLRFELPNDRAGVLKKISDIGYKYLETYVMDGKHHLGFPIADYRKMLDDLGLQVLSAHIPTGRPQPELVGSLTNNFEKVIEDAHYLGQRYIICPYLQESERTSLDDYKATIDLLNACGEKCKAAGITFCYHNHDFEFLELEGQVPMEMIIEQTDPELVQMELDIYWSTKAGRDTFELFDKYPNRFALWHVKDMSKTRENETTFVGDGSINYAEIFQKARNTGMEHFFVEQEHYPTPVFEGLQKSFEYLNALKV